VEFRLPQLGEQAITHIELHGFVLSSFPHKRGTERESGEKPGAVPGSSGEHTHGSLDCRQPDTRPSQSARRTGHPQRSRVRRIKSPGHPAPSASLGRSTEYWQRW
jgi:hypothetical protein